MAKSSKKKVAVSWNKDGINPRSGRSRCTHINEAGGRCAQVAVDGKLHCRFHLGNQTRTRSGRYGAVAFPALALQIYEAMQATPDLKEEVALLRGMLADFLQKWGPSSRKKAAGHTELITLVRQVVDSIRETIEAISRIEARTSITPNQAEAVIERMIFILQEEMPEQALRRLAEKFMLVEWPGGVGGRTAPTYGFNERMNPISKAMAGVSGGNGNGDSHAANN